MSKLTLDRWKCCVCLMLPLDCHSMVLSKAAVSSFVISGHHCPSINSADDMFLGSVAAALNWDIVHSPLFHQVSQHE